MNDSDLLALSASEQARELAKGSLSCLALTNLYLSRIDDLNGQLNAFTHVAPRRARWAAKQWDRAYRKGQQHKGPLSGIPTGIKDLAMVRGMPTRFGSRGVPPITTAKDGLGTKRIRRAGMIIIGKLATSEFGAMPVTEPDTHPPTRTPFNLDHSAGGSSGGTGAAVSGGLLPIAQGSDGAGSIRIPSAIGNLVGLKTSRGLISHITPVDTEMRLAGIGPLARTVEDLAAFLDAITDWPNDFHGRHQRQLKNGLRVSLSTASPIADTPPEYQEAATAVAKILEDQGCIVTPKPWLDVDIDEFLILWKRLLANAPRLIESRLQPITQWLRTEGKKIKPAQAVATRIRLEQEVLGWFGESDLWVSPTMAMKSPKIGAWRDEDPEKSFHNVLGMGAYTAGFNVSGQPAISIPMGFCDDGLPIGVQIAGRVGSDALLVQVAHAIEEALGGFRVPLPI